MEQRLARLKAEHGLDIKYVILTILVISYSSAPCNHRRSLLANLNKKFDVPSVQKPPPPEIATQAVLEKVAEDPAQVNGVGTISTLLSNEGVLLPW